MKRALLVLLAGLALAPATADAAVVGRAANEGGGFVYSADPGEVNNVTVSGDGDAFVISDPGVTIIPLQDCSALAPDRVRCTGINGVSIELGDRDDRGAVADNTPGSIYLYGDQGADELIGSAAAGGLVGGPGNDVLRGGSGTTLIQGIERVGWETGKRPANTLVQPDTITCTPPPPDRAPYSFVEADRLDNVDAACANVTRAPEPGPPPAPSNRKGKCKRSSTTGGAKIVARSKEGVMFTKRLKTYGCLYSAGRIASLHDEGGGITLTGQAKPVFNGRYVAYATNGSAIGDEFDRVVAWDLRNGFVQFHASSTAVLSMVVKKNGSVAWTANSIVGTSGPSLIDVREISLDDKQGDLLLARGANIDPASLKLSAGSTIVSWKRRGRTESAPLR